MALSLDFYGTLAQHRDGRGRGARIMEYFAAHGLESQPWSHQVLYDVFGEHGKAYDPDCSAAEHLAYCEQVAGSLFRRLSVRGTEAAAEPAAHALAIWRIIGPDNLVLFDDALPALAALRAQGHRVVVVSNWTCGLHAFCRALGIADHVEHVVASQDVGAAKPDPRIFHEACRRLGVPPDRVLHVGDSVTDDVEGARQAGLRAIELRRVVPGSRTAAEPGVITSLAELPGLLASAR